jgi:recA bacterial DNA recombination protein
MAFPASVAPAAPAAASAVSGELRRDRRDRLESLLRARKLDRTLTTTLPDAGYTNAVAPFGVTTLDARLGGGVSRGHVSELIGPVSSGRTSLAWTWLGAATSRGESVALIDTFDRFDPTTGAQCGIELSRLLWVRGQAITKTTGAVDPAWLPGARTVEGPGTLLERAIDRALKALNLVLQSGVCTAVVLDFADVPLAGIRRVPLTTWMRLQRIVEGTDTACLLLGPVPLARSAGGVTITTGVSVEARQEIARRAKADLSRRSAPVSERAKAEWAGQHDRCRRLAGLSVAARLTSPRRIVEGMVSLATTTRADACAVE